MFNNCIDTWQRKKFFKILFSCILNFEFFFSTSSYCSPNTPRRVYHHHAGERSQLYPNTAAGGLTLQYPNIKYPAPNTLHYNPAAFSSAVQYSAGKSNATLQYNTGKKRTLVQYKYPDVLPSENLNQNYYVWKLLRINF